MAPEKEIDLLPDEWSSKDMRKKPAEPFFGSGLPDVLWYVAGFTVVWTVVHYFVR